MAHRGARSLAPENTLAAAASAVAAGAEMWELDVQLSADRHLVVIHDDTLERTSNVAMRPEFAGRRPWAVESFTLAELKSLDCGSWFAGTDPFGTVAGGEAASAGPQAFEGVSMPTLAEALFFSWKSGLAVNVEIKDLKGRADEAWLAGLVLRETAATGMMDRVLFSSFNPGYLKALKAIDRNAATALLSEFHLPDPLTVLKALEASAYHPRRDVLTPDEAVVLLEAGYWVNVWTVNDPAEMLLWAKPGVSGLITDYPQRLAGLRDGLREASGG